MANVLPKKLYKYRPWTERTRELLSRHRLFFASPLTFNDPFDCGLDVLCSGATNQEIVEAVAFGQVREKHPKMPRHEMVEATKQVGAAIFKNHLEEVRDTFIEKVRTEITNHCGVFCLCELNDDILMWSHYADCHKGVCLEFSAIDESADPFTNISPVVYGDDFPTVNLHALVTNADLRQSAPWMLTKATRWSYEKEWRALEYSGPGPKPFDPKNLTGVILGCQMPDENRREVRAVIEASGLPIKLYEAKMARNQFHLEIAGMT